MLLAYNWHIVLAHLWHIIFKTNALLGITHIKMIQYNIKEQLNGAGKLPISITINFKTSIWMYNRTVISSCMKEL